MRINGIITLSRIWDDGVTHSIPRQFMRQVWSGVCVVYEESGNVI